MGLNNALTTSLLLFIKGESDWISSLPELEDQKAYYYKYGKFINLSVLHAGMLVLAITSSSISLAIDS